MASAAPPSTTVPATREHEEDGHEEEDKNNSNSNNNTQSGNSKRRPEDNDDDDDETQPQVATTRVEPQVDAMETDQQEQQQPDPAALRDTRIVGDQQQEAVDDTLIPHPPPTQSQEENDFDDLAAAFDTAGGIDHFYDSSQGDENEYSEAIAHNSNRNGNRSSEQRKDETPQSRSGSNSTQEESSSSFLKKLIFGTDYTEHDARTAIQVLNLEQRTALLPIDDSSNRLLSSLEITRHLKNGLFMKYSQTGFYRDREMDREFAFFAYRDVTGALVAIAFGSLITINWLVYQEPINFLILLGLSVWMLEVLIGNLKWSRDRLWVVRIRQILRGFIKVSTVISTSAIPRSTSAFSRGHYAPVVIFRLFLLSGAVENRFVWNLLCTVGLMVAIDVDLFLRSEPMNAVLAAFVIYLVVGSIFLFSASLRQRMKHQELEALLLGALFQQGCEIEARKVEKLVATFTPTDFIDRFLKHQYAVGLSGRTEDHPEGTSASVIVCSLYNFYARSPYLDPIKLFRMILRHQLDFHDILVRYPNIVHIVTHGDSSCFCTTRRSSKRHQQSSSETNLNTNYENLEAVQLARGAKAAVDFCVEVLQMTMSRPTNESSVFRDDPLFSLTRCGVSTGPLYAGLMGESHCSYTIVGAAPNDASSLVAVCGKDLAICDRTWSKLSSSSRVKNGFEKVQKANNYYPAASVSSKTGKDYHFEASLVQLSPLLLPDAHPDNRNEATALSETSPAGIIGPSTGSMVAAAAAGDSFKDLSLDTVYPTRVEEEDEHSKRREHLLNFLFGIVQTAAEETPHHQPDSTTGFARIRREREAEDHFELYEFNSAPAPVLLGPVGGDQEASSSQFDPGAALENSKKKTIYQLTKPTLLEKDLFNRYKIPEVQEEFLRLRLEALGNQTSMPLVFSLSVFIAASIYHPEIELYTILIGSIFIFVLSVIVFIFKGKLLVQYVACLLPKIALAIRIIISLVLTSEAQPSDGSRESAIFAVAQTTACGLFLLPTVGVFSTFFESLANFLLIFVPTCAFVFSRVRPGGGPEAGGSLSSSNSTTTIEEDITTFWEHPRNLENRNPFSSEQTTGIVEILYLAAMFTFGVCLAWSSSKTTLVQLESIKRTEELTKRIMDLRTITSQLIPYFTPAVFRERISRLEIQVNGSAETWSRQVVAVLSLRHDVLWKFHPSCFEDDLTLFRDRQEAPTPFHFYREQISGTKTLNVGGGVLASESTLVSALSIAIAKIDKLTHERYPALSRHLLAGDVVFVGSASGETPSEHKAALAHAAKVGHQMVPFILEVKKQIFPGVVAALHFDFCTRVSLPLDLRHRSRSATARSDNSTRRFNCMQQYGAAEYTARSIVQAVLHLDLIPKQTPVENNSSASLPNNPSCHNGFIFLTVEFLDILKYDSRDPVVSDHRSGPLRDHHRASSRVATTPLREQFSNPLVPLGSNATTGSNAGGGNSTTPPTADTGDEPTTRRVSLGSSRSVPSFSSDPSQDPPEHPVFDDSIHSIAASNTNFSSNSSQQKKPTVQEIIEAARDFLGTHASDHALGALTAFELAGGRTLGVPLLPIIEK